MLAGNLNGRVHSDILGVDGSRVGGVVFSVLATGPKGFRFEPSLGDGFLRAIKIRSTPIFRMRSKPGSPMS
jgi:hypothetical protein